MSVMILISLCFQAVAFPSRPIDKRISRGQTWLNVKYVACLKNSLPCECQKVTSTYYLLVLDDIPQSKTFGVALSKFDEMEPGMYPIKKVTSGEYLIFKSKSDASVWAKLIIKGKELKLVDNGIVSTFVESKSSDNDDVDQYGKDNVALLNEALVVKGYPRLEEIVNERMLSCDCNKWMGERNVLSVKRAARSWIIEIQNDSLHIFKITNVARSQRACAN